jgi:stage V sporulation protein R
MEHLLRTITDYEFLRRFLTSALIEQYHLNRIPKMMAGSLGLPRDEIIREDNHWLWLKPEPIKAEMLSFFTHFNRPRIYIVDTDFIDGGLLLFHRNDRRKLRRDWIKPTLRNVNYLWKSAVSLVSADTLYTFSNNQFSEKAVAEVPFEQIVERMKKSEKPLQV